jgi:5-methylcytosine-specific restriction endonuclease McrA
MACRSEAQKVAGITVKQLAGLSLGSQKGTNHRTGYHHREESKRKVAQTNRDFWAANRDKAMERGAKVRGPLNVRWKGGVSKLNESIRRMTENRRWMDAIKARDGCCVRCGSVERLESHHRKGLARLIAELGIASREDARRQAAALWSISNGITLCEPCHYAEHGRRRAA